MPPARKPKKLSKPRRCQVKLRMGAEVPFADDTGGVPGGAERIGHGRFGERQAVRGGGGVPCGIIFAAEALLIAPVNRPARDGLQTGQES